MGTDVAFARIGYGNFFIELRVRTALGGLVPLRHVLGVAT